MGARERSSAGALPVGVFGFLGVFLPPIAPGRSDVTAESQFASQALQGGWRRRVAGEQGSTASGGQTVQIAGQGSWSSMFAAQVEVGVAVVVGSGCGETWMRRWARLDGRPALGS